MNHKTLGPYLIALATAFVVFGGVTSQAAPVPLKNIVLVHGVWADGSGWKGVYDILVKDGYNVKAVITKPAWRSKPSWMLVAGSDRTISPDLERWYASRAGSHMVEVPGASHCVYVSRPKEVAALIEEASRDAQK